MVSRLRFTAGHHITANRWVGILIAAKSISGHRLVVSQSIGAIGFAPARLIAF
jgi:hypothetical protein